MVALSAVLLSAAGCWTLIQDSNRIAAEARLKRLDDARKHDAFMANITPVTSTSFKSSGGNLWEGTVLYNSAGQILGTVRRANSETVWIQMEKGQTLTIPREKVKALYKVKQ